MNKLTDKNVVVDKASNTDILTALKEHSVYDVSTIVYEYVQYMLHTTLDDNQIDVFTDLLDMPITRQVCWLKKGVTKARAALYVKRKYAVHDIIGKRNKSRNCNEIPDGIANHLQYIHTTTEPSVVCEILEKANMSVNEYFEMCE